MIPLEFSPLASNNAAAIITNRKANQEDRQKWLKYFHFHPIFSKLNLLLTQTDAIIFPFPHIPTLSSLSKLRHSTEPRLTPLCYHISWPHCSAVLRSAVCHLCHHAHIPIIGSSATLIVINVPTFIAAKGEHAPESSGSCVISRFCSRKCLFWAISYLVNSQETFNFIWLKSSKSWRR